MMGGLIRESFPEILSLFMTVVAAIVAFKIGKKIGKKVAYDKYHNGFIEATEDLKKEIDICKKLHKSTGKFSDCICCLHDNSGKVGE